MEDNFSIENAFQTFLKQSFPANVKVSEEQIIEMRKVFYSGCGVVLLMVKEEFRKDPGKVETVVDALRNQINNRLLKEGGRLN